MNATRDSYSQERHVRIERDGWVVYEARHTTTRNEHAIEQTMAAYREAHPDAVMDGLVATVVTSGQTRRFVCVAVPRWVARGRVGGRGEK